MAKEKKKKSKLKTYLIMTGGFFIFCLFMLMGASSASVGTEGSRQASVASAQTSLLESYINSRSEQQRALVEAAKTENTSRGGTDTKGGKSYIKKLAPEKTKFNVSWDSYFVGQMMANAGIDISEWDAAASVFATKLHKSGKFSIAENYIPREGNIVFWGKKLRSLSAGQTIKARHCGIVTKVEMITDHTLIKAMRIISQRNTISVINVWTLMKRNILKTKKKRRSKSIRKVMVFMALSLEMSNSLRLGESSQKGKLP